MPGGLKTTFDTLAQTANEAACGLLLDAIDQSPRDVRERAFTALLARRSEEAEIAILARWGRLTERWKQLVAERNGWISRAIRKAVLGADADLYRAGCEAAVWTRDYDLIPVLVVAATDKANPQAALAAATVLQLAELLAEELAAPRDYRIRRDADLQRQHVLNGLERAAGEFEQHGRRELVEAFLLLAERENPALKRILQSPSDRSFAPLLDALAGSSRGGVQRLLLSFLDDSHAPLAAIHALARRRDLAFIRQLTRKIGIEPSSVARINLRRIDTIPWMQDNLALLDALHEVEQAGAVQLAALSNLSRLKAQDVVAYVLQHGKLAGRRVAAKALAQFRGADANHLALKTLDDDDPQVRAAAAVQLRERGVPGAINRLIELLDSSHQIEREAAQTSLGEFRFEGFLATFDDLPAETRKSSGALVRRIDPLALSKLKTELTAPARSRRRRGVELAVALGAVGELIETLAELLKEDDQYLRVETIRALASETGPQARAILREALLDPHPLVQEAAEAALAERASAMVSPNEPGPISSAAPITPGLSTQEFAGAPA